MINAPTQTFVCATTIYPSRFVKLNTASDYTILQADDDDELIIGVSQEHSRFPPVSGASTAAGTLADLTEIGVYGVQQTCYLCLGTTITRGDILSSDANGKGVTAVTGKYFGAVALESGVADDLIRVNVLLGDLD